jgi:hypothetical protein
MIAETQTLDISEPAQREVRHVGALAFPLRADPATGPPAEVGISTGCTNRPLLELRRGPRQVNFPPEIAVYFR